MSSASCFRALYQFPLRISEHRVFVHIVSIHILFIPAYRAQHNCPTVALIGQIHHTPVTYSSVFSLDSAFIFSLLIDGSLLTSLLPAISLRVSAAKKHRTSYVAFLLPSTTISVYNYNYNNRSGPENAWNPFLIEHCRLTLIRQQRRGRFDNSTQDLSQFPNREKWVLSILLLLPRRWRRCENHQVRV